MNIPKQECTFLTIREGEATSGEARAVTPPPPVATFFSRKKKNKPWVEPFESQPSFPDPLPTPKTKSVPLDNFHRLIRPSSTFLSGWLPPKKMRRAEVISGAPNTGRLFPLPTGYGFQHTFTLKHLSPYLFRALGWGELI